MKNIAFGGKLVIALTILLVGAFVVPSNGLADLDSGLVAYWSFDNQSDPGHDDSEDGNDGTVYGATWIPDGISGGALDFDGEDDYVDLGNPTSLNISYPITVVAWIKRASFGTADDILSHGYGGYAFWLTHVLPTQNRVNFGKQGGGGPIVLGVTVIEDHHLHQVAATYNGTAGKIYIDGQPDNSVDMSGTFDNSDSLRIGGCVTYGEYFDGIMDEVRVYNRALSDAEVEYLYNNPGGGLYANFGANPISGSIPLTVQFTDSSLGTPTSWFWDFGDDSTSTDSCPTHTYNDTGYFDVKLVVTDSISADSLVKYDYIHVTPLVCHLINVPADYLTIQEAIDAAWDCDTVLVQPGTYVEKINFNGHNIVLGSLFLTTGDTSYISSTVIDGNSYGPVVTFDNGEDSTAVISGFTIQNGGGYGPRQPSGGIHCNGSHPRITSNTISGNSGGDVGGISCYFSNPIISNNTISGNSGGGAGGICCMSYSNPIISNNTISGNFGFLGAGILCYDYSNPTISNNTISADSGDLGGGICCMSSSNPIISNNTISGNSADGGGGGIYCSESSNPIISNNTISANSSGFSGGGIYCSESSNPIISNNTITGNSAEFGGGIYCLESSNPTIRNNIISNNLHGGGIACSYNSYPLITYNDVWNNAGGNFPDCPAGVGDTTWGTNINGTPCDSFYNIICDPWFCYPDIDNYYLADASCCVGAGCDSLGNPDSAVDIGAFGVGCASSPDFTIYAEPDTQEVQVGASVDYDVILTSLHGFASSCTLTISGLPADASASFSPNPVVPSDTSLMTVNTTISTPPGTYDLTITATEIAKTQTQHSTQVVLIILEPDFTIDAEPDTQEVQAGNSAYYDVILTSLHGFDSPCTLTVSGLPQYAAAAFDPLWVIPTDTSTLTIVVADSTPTGIYGLTVTGKEMVPVGGKEHSTQVVLVVTPPPDFTIQAQPETLEVSQTGEGSYDVTLTSLYGFSSQCTLTVTGLPQDASGQFDPGTLIPTGTSSLTVAVAATTPVGTYDLTITGTEMVKEQNAVQHSVDVVLVVTPPPPTLSWSNKPGYVTDGVFPDSGLSGTIFTFRVVYTDPSDLPPQSGYPELNIDLNGDGDFADDDEGSFTMAVVDADTNYTGGREYFYNATLPTSSDCQYSFSAKNSAGVEATGEPTSLKPGPVILDPASELDLYIYASDITFSDPNPDEGEVFTIYAVVHNNSDSSLSDVSVTFYDGYNLLDQSIVSYVPSRSSAQTSTEVSFGTMGFYPIRVGVDEENSYAEWNELNNWAVRPVKVGDYPVEGDIIVEASINSPVYTHGWITIPGSARYSPLEWEEVCGARVTATIQETGQQYTTYTNNLGNFYLRFWGPDNAGTYTVQVEVTDFTLTGDTTLTLEVINQDKPDLIVDVSVTGQFMIGRNLTVKTKVSNVGGGPAYDFKTELYEDGAYFYDEDIGLLEAGQSLWLTDQIISFAEVGIHCVKAITDVEDSVDEFSEANNRDDTCFYVADTVDLKVDYYDVSVSNTTPADLDPISILGRVHNLGGTVVYDVPVRFYIDSVQFGDDVTIPEIQAGQSQQVASTITWTVDFNRHLVEVMADPDNLFPESDKSNNRGALPIPYDLYPYYRSRCPTCWPYYWPYFFSKHTAYVDQPVTVYGSVRNRGGFDLLGQVNIQISNGLEGILGVITVESVLNHQQSIATGSLDHSFTDVGTHTVTATVDYDGQYDEWNEGTDNIYSNTIYVDSLRPDLMIHSDHIIPTSVTPDSGDTVDFTATVYNVGQITAVNVWVQFLMDDIQLGDLVPIDSIPTGGDNYRTVQSTDPWIATCEPPNLHICKVVVDPSLLIAELDESNNAATKSIIPCGAPDLVVDAILFPGCERATGNQISIGAAVVNNGALAASAYVDFYFYDADLIRRYIGSDVVDVPEAGGADTAEITWTCVMDSTEICAWITDSDPMESDTSNNYECAVFRSFMRGDVNADSIINVGDVVYLVWYLYKGGPAPMPVAEVGDVNFDGEVSVGDVVFLINYLYRGGPAPCEDGPMAVGRNGGLPLYRTPLVQPSK